MLEALVGAYGTQQVDAGHAGHVPVGHQKIEATALQHRQRRSAIVSLGGVGETQIPQEVLDDPSHRREIVNDEDFHVLVQVDLRTVPNVLRLQLRPLIVKPFLPASTPPSASAPFAQTRTQTRRALAMQLAHA